MGPVGAGLRLAVCLSVPLGLFGCQSAFYAATGEMMTDYAEHHLLPAMMASGDLGMACETGATMTAMLESAGRVSKGPERAALVMHLGAGMCAQQEAWEAELHQLRAEHAGLVGEAHDAEIVASRAHRVAAERFHGAYVRFRAAFGDGLSCPALSPADEPLYILGLSTGLLAAVHDRAAGGTPQVPPATLRAVVALAGCLPNGRWWRLPDALRAAAWSSVPGVSPAGLEPWSVLEEAAVAGDRAGVRLARAFQVLTAASAGRQDIVRRAIVAHARSLSELGSHRRWAMLDHYATAMVRHVSDTLWTRANGFRTPVDRLGAFPEPVVVARAVSPLAGAQIVPFEL